MVAFLAFLDTITLILAFVKGTGVLSITALISVFVLLMIIDEQNKKINRMDSENRNIVEKTDFDTLRIDK